MFMGNDLEVPIHLCECHSWHLKPFATFERIQELSLALSLGNLVYEPILAIELGGLYHVFFGWDQVTVRKSLNHQRILLRVAEFSREEIVKHGFVEPSKVAGTHPLVLAWQLKEIKTTGNFSNLELSKIFGSSESNITRLLNFTKLIPELQKLFESSAITKTQARELSGLKVYQQRAISKAAESQSGSPAENIEKYMSTTIRVRKVRVDAIVPKSSERDNEREKGVDDRRYEVWLSEYLGCPVSLENLSGSGAGAIVCRFYSKDELFGILEKVTFPNEVCCNLTIGADGSGAVSVPYSTVSELECFVPSTEDY